MDLYYLLASPPCRSVLLLAKLMDITFNLKMVNIQAGEQMTPEFIKMNPQHTVPTLNDNGFYLSESRAIMGYLVNQYGKNDTLYPKDPKKRAVVDQRLYFDAGTLQARMFDYFIPVVFNDAAPDEAKLQKANDALGTLDMFIEGMDYAAGDQLTIADIALVVTVSNLEGLGLDISQHPNVAKWYEKVIPELPGYEEINGEGVKAYAGVFRSKAG